MSQSFQEMMKVVNDFRVELDTRNIRNNRSPLTEKYFNRLLQVAAQRGEQWAM